VCDETGRLVVSDSGRYIPCCSDDCLKYFLAKMALVLDKLDAVVLATSYIFGVESIEFNAYLDLLGFPNLITYKECQKVPQSERK